MGYAPGLGAGEPAASWPRPGMAAADRHVALEPGPLSGRRAAGPRPSGGASPPRQRLLALVASRPVRPQLPRLASATGGLSLVPRCRRVALTSRAHLHALQRLPGGARAVSE